VLFYKTLCGFCRYCNIKREGTSIAKLLKPNDRSIQLTQVRLIGVDGAQLGVVSYDRAKELAAEAGEDLVLVSDRSVPPVVRIMNFGKLRYEQKKNLKQQRRSTAVQKVKEVKFRINIDQHDYETKLKHALDFLAKKFRVKVTLAMRGREMAHQDMGYEVIARVSADLAPYADADGKPKLLGRNISVNFAPKPETGRRSAAGDALTGSESKVPQTGKDENNAEA